VALLLTKKDPRLTTCSCSSSSRWRSPLRCSPRPSRHVSCRSFAVICTRAPSSRSGLAAADPVARLSRYQLGLDVLLGAFAAGIVVRLFTEGSKAQSCAASSKPSGTGSCPDLLHRERMHFDLKSLTTGRARCCVSPLPRLMLVVRGTPASCSTERCCRATNGAARPLLGDGLPIIVVITPSDREAGSARERLSSRCGGHPVGVALPGPRARRLRATRFAFVHEASTMRMHRAAARPTCRHPMLSVHREPTSRKEVR